MKVSLTLGIFVVTAIISMTIATLMHNNNEQYSFDEVAEQCFTCIDEWFFDDTTEVSEFCTDILIFDEQCPCSLAVNKFDSLKNPTFEQRMTYNRITHFIGWYLSVKSFDNN